MLYGMSVSLDEFNVTSNKSQDVQYLLILGVNYEISKTFVDYNVSPTISCVLDQYVLT